MAVAMGGVEPSRRRLIRTRITTGPNRPRRAGLQRAGLSKLERPSVKQTPPSSKDLFPLDRAQSSAHRPADRAAFSGGRQMLQFCSG